MTTPKQEKLSRRSFMAVSAGVAAATVIAPGAKAFAVGNSAAHRPLRIGIVGFGKAAQRAMRRLEFRNAHCDIKDEMSCACDVSARARSLAGSVGIRVLDGWEQLVSSRDVDAVYIATPDHHHTAIAIAALERGKPVYCEAPMANRLEDAKAMHDAAERAGVPLQIGIEAASEWMWLMAADYIREGAIGKPIWCQSSHLCVKHDGECELEQPISQGDVDWPAFLGGAPQTAFDSNRFHAWRNYWDYSNGPAAEALFCKMARIIKATDAGVPVRVSAAGGIYSRAGGESPDSFVMTAEYAGGMKIVLAASLPAETNSPVIIQGTEGRMCIEERRLHIQSNVCADSNGNYEDVTDVSIVESTQIANWLACIRDGRQCSFDHRLGYATSVAIGLAVRAHRERRTFEWDAATHTARVSSPRGIVA
jgi:predicted dehydrogenase